jgi:hypothetical protein
MLGALLMTLCSAGVLSYLLYELVRTVSIRSETPAGFGAALAILLSLLAAALLVVVGAVAVIGVAFFGGAFIRLGKACLRPTAVVELLPEGLCGNTNIGRIAVPWSCIAAVRLETVEKAPVLGVEMTRWPPHPLWKDCSSDVRRLLWQRHNRRQMPIHVYLDEAAAPPEVILQAIENELAHYRRSASEPE